MNPDKKFPKIEHEKDFVEAGKFLGILGQSQYVMRPLTNAFPEEYPNLGEGIRYEGSYDDYHFIKIHKDDILKYAERYIDWKNSKMPLGRMDKEKTLEEIKKELEN
jgi:hypothetical protein